MDDTEPSDPASASLDFGPDLSTRNLTEVYPEIGQLFLIGDGKTYSVNTENVTFSLDGSRKGYRSAPTPNTD